MLLNLPVVDESLLKPKVLFGGHAVLVNRSSLREGVYQRGLASRESNQEVRSAAVLATRPIQLQASFGLMNREAQLRTFRTQKA